MSRVACGGLLAVALVLGLAVRLAWLDARPMHHDEANQAVKFGRLLETGEYRYDPADHHGPALYYLTLPSAWLRGRHTLASLDEVSVRLVPALFGGGIILLLAVLGRRLAPGAAAAAALLAAVSPALTYYSRFYIQESLFAFFTLAFLVALGRCVETRSTWWGLGAGLAAGLALATKETAVITLAGGLGACAVAVASAGWRATPGGLSGGERAPALRPGWGAGAPPVRPCLAGVGMALVLVCAFYSSFFTHLSGVTDWLGSFRAYGARGLEGGVHRQPWDYYLRLLSFSRSEGVVWTEAAILVLAAVGGVVAFRRGERGSWPRYVAVYTLFTGAVFSLLPYKTPWNLLPFHVGGVALAGYAVARLAAVPAGRMARAAIVAVVVAAAAHLGVQCWRANFRYPADPRNPYAYAHTSPDFLRLLGRVRDIAAVHPDGNGMWVEVIAGPYEQWPLPWYLRAMPRVGYWSRAADAPARRAPLIIASQDNADALDAELGERYVPEYYGLRAPDVLLSVYVERTLWEQFLKTR